MQRKAWCFGPLVSCWCNDRRSASACPWLILTWSSWLLRWPTEKYLSSKLCFWKPATTKSENFSLNSLEDCEGYYVLEIRKLFIYVPCKSFFFMKSAKLGWNCSWWLEMWNASRLPILYFSGHNHKSSGCHLSRHSLLTARGNLLWSSSIDLIVISFMWYRS